MKRRRRIFQFAFLTLTLVGVFVVQGNAERWCPFGGVEALYGYLHEGNLLCSLGVSNFYILGAVLLMTLLLRRAFCGYVCPIGAMSEWLRGVGRRIGLPTVRAPAGLDRALGLLKYAVLGVILYFTWRASELIFRGFDPCYALLSRHGEDITFWAYIVAGAIVVGSLLVMMPFCRWLCPLAAVLSPFSRAGLARVRRDPEACSGCGSCADVCPMAIPVDQVQQVTAARCLSCLNCLEVCPTAELGSLRFGPPPRLSRVLGRSWSQAVVMGVILLLISSAVAAVYVWPLPSFIQVAAARPPEPADTAVLDLKIENLTCRGRATLLMYYLERDDDLALSGHLRVEAWPGPGFAAVRVIYDPSKTDPDSIRQAVTEAYFDATAGFWRPSPFVIEGYDPLALPGE